MKPQSIVKLLAQSAAVSALVFLVVSWPLARHFADGIPSSIQNTENPPVRRMMPGDHLQLLYHYDLVLDMLKGRIPWWHNVYEFNTGDDAARFRPGSYFLPFSAIYALIAGFAGQATAWNLVQFLSVWGSILFSWIWFRRFTSDRWAVALATLIVVLSPFRWISLFGGSPSGVALVWVPLFALTIDHAVRKATWTSGLYAGLMLLLMFWADIHVFYFAALCTPLFALISWSALVPGEAVPWRRWPRVLPGLLFFLAIMAVFIRWRTSNIAASTMSEGRGMHEILNYSPDPAGFLFGGSGRDDWIFLGVAVLVLLVLGFSTLLIAELLRPRRRILRIATVIAVTGALGFFAILALGYKGPGDGSLFGLARELIPGYAMIRQPAKIFAVVPLLAGWVIATGLGGCTTDAIRPRRVARLVMLAGAAGLTAQFFLRYSATICLLDAEQPAYRRVQEAGEGVPRAMVIPLWPGESSDTAVPLYYAHKYGIRLLNGYSPVVSTQYFENIYRRLESINQGHATDEQLDFLIASGIRHLLLHENMYPENPSPFPVHEAIRRLRAHPRLAYAGQSGPVHGFDVLEQAQPVALSTAPVPHRLFPTRRWEAEGLCMQEAERVPDETASAGGLWRASREGIALMNRIRVAPSPELAWWIRVRGAGQLAINTDWGDQRIDHEPVSVNGADWVWHMVKIPAQPGFAPVGYSITLAAGEAEVDMIFLGPDNWPLVWPDSGIEIPAVHFFHGGFTDSDGTSVVLKPDQEQDSVRLYGPRLPVPAGDYVLRVAFSSDAPVGKKAGRVAIVQGARTPIAEHDLIAGQPFEARWTAGSNLPVSFQIRYLREGDLVVHSLALAPDRGTAVP